MQRVNRPVLAGEVDAGLLLEAGQLRVTAVRRGAVGAGKDLAHVVLSALHLLDMLRIGETKGLRALRRRELDVADRAVTEADPRASLVVDGHQGAGHAVTDRLTAAFGDRAEEQNL